MHTQPKISLNLDGRMCIAKRMCNLRFSLVIFLLYSSADQLNAIVVDTNVVLLRVNFTIAMHCIDDSN